jgi:hypothetical protein
MTGKLSLIHAEVVFLRNELANAFAKPPIVSDRQHSGFRWMTLEELTSSPDIHHNARAYFL